MKVLVSGASGFIGSHIIPCLVEKGYDVWALERYVTGRYANPKNVKTVFGDLREYFTMKNIIRQVQPDFVIHLAAISPVSYSYQHPNEVLETNLKGTVNIAEACLREVPHFKQFLFASTSETYGNGPTPKTEDTPQNPNSPYAVSKLAAEKYLLYMNAGYNFPVTVLRPFNTYGRKRDFHFVIEHTIMKMLTEETCRMGDLSPTRDFMYVEDHVNAYLTCLENPLAIGEVFNFCSGTGIKIEDMVYLIKKLTGFEGEIEGGTKPKRPLDINILIGSYKKAEEVLGWKPQYTLEEGLKKTIIFWQSNPNKLVDLVLT